ncbi:MAG: hypothetical protein QOJ64_872 [Acidobacteriota bacterium]|jgi:thioredoxin-related protein|nr:hypothetical protein [Acidobacteriota bacterium]
MLQVQRETSDRHLVREEKIMIRRMHLIGLMTGFIFALIITAAGETQAQKITQPEKKGKDDSSLDQSGVKGQGTIPKYVPVHKYDPLRNAAEDLKAALAEARRTGKRVLVKVGGEWCSWCHTMDGFFEKHPDLMTLGEKNFVILKINFSEENPNVEVLSRYPEINGYPHIFVLDKDGKLLQSQDTGLLEEGKSYNLVKFFEFLRRWSPPGHDGD